VDSYEPEPTQKVPWPKDQPVPAIHLRTIEHQTNPIYHVEFDRAKIGDANQYLALPKIFKGHPTTTKNVSKDFKILPRGIKFSSDEKYHDIDKIRN